MGAKQNTQVLSKNVKMSTKDKCCWFVGGAVFILALVANGYFTDVDAALRVLTGIAVMVFCVGIVAVTHQGQAFMEFVGKARMELRKVVWPTRQEATRNTVLVVLIVMIVSGMLWGIDAMFAWLIAKFVG